MREQEERRRAEYIKKSVRLRRPFEEGQLLEVSVLDIPCDIDESLVAFTQGLLILDCLSKSERVPRQSHPGG